MTKKKYFIISSDDNSKEDIRLAKLLDKYGLFGTFFFNSGFIGNDGKLTSEDIYKYFFESNHCIGSHTLTHSVLSITSEDEFEVQIKKDKQNLEQIFKKEIDMFSYPGNLDPIDVSSKKAERYLKSLGFVSARHIYSTQKFHPPKDPMRWYPTGHIKWLNESRKKLEWEHDIEPFSALKQFLHQDEGNLLHLWTHAWEWNEDDWKSAESFFGIVSKTDIECISYSDYLKTINS